MQQHRVRFLNRLLDEQFRIPGTRYRIELNGILGLIPGVGDVTGLLLSTYILYEAIRLRSTHSGCQNITLAITSSEAYPVPMDTYPSLPLELWERTPPEV